MFIVFIHGVYKEKYSLFERTWVFVAISRKVAHYVAKLVRPGLK